MEYTAIIMLLSTFILNDSSVLEEHAEPNILMLTVTMLINNVLSVLIMNFFWLKNKEYGRQIIEYVQSDAPPETEVDTVICDCAPGKKWYRNNAHHIGDKNQTI